jgi:hypothetical protein
MWALYWESAGLTLKARCDLSEHRTPRTGNAVGAPIDTSTNTVENESKSYNKMEQSHIPRMGLTFQV